jgi:hypothetical protein
MNEPCAQLEDLLTAHRRGAVSTPQRQHAAECAECSDALLLEAVLREAGIDARAASDPPAFGRVVVQLRRRLSAESARRARRLNLGLRVAGLGLTALGVLATGFWGVRFYGAEAGGWVVSTIRDLAAGSTASASSSAEALAAISAMALAGLSYALWSSWVEE